MATITTITETTRAVPRQERPSDYFLKQQEQHDAYTAPPCAPSSAASPTD